MLMKKIFVIALVKNESDIIESFCRYNLIYCDGILIQDDGSSDDTKEIIQKLINEGLSIYWTNIAKLSVENKVEQAKVAINEYSANLVVPLDADEFLYHTDGINPRDLLEALHEDVEYQIPWRTYVYEKEPDIKLGFMPNNFKHYRNTVLENAQGHAGTTLITKYLIKEKQVKLPIGAHWLFYPEEHQGSVKIECPKKLVCAHFPVRSKKQIRKKVIPFWLTKWARSDRVRDVLDVHQLGVLFNEIRDNGEVTPEKMTRYSIEYSVRNVVNKLGASGLEEIVGKLGDDLIINGSMNVSFCVKKLILQYTNYDDDKTFLRPILKEIDNAVTFLDKESAEKTKQIDEFTQSITRNAALFFDTGNGFNAEKMQFFSFTGSMVEIFCQIPENTVAVRLDPVEEGYGCVVSNLEILSYSGIVKYKPINGYIDETGNLIFVTTDPQINLQGVAHSLKIKYTILLLSEFSHYRVLNNYIITSQEQDSLKNSRSWRITKPLRKMGDFIRRYKVLCLFAKTLLSIKRVGIRATLKKVKQFTDKQKQVSLLLSHTYLSKPERIVQTNTIFPKQIKISIITPLFNTQKKFLREMIDSVRHQTYSSWELCLVDGSDKGYRYVERICKKYTRKDKRIIYKRLAKNQGISENSNRAIEMSTGDYLGLLDHDDVLHSSALYEIVKAICNESADLIYTDEAIFTSDFTIFNKHHKPDYGIDTLRSNNYICHFLVFSRQIVEQAGVFRKEYDGSQDHDLILRYTAAASRIVHIPKALYFWRNHENSVASDISTKLYAIEAGKNAVKNHLIIQNISAQVESTKICQTIYRIVYDLVERPLVSIIIPNKDNISFLKKCLASIYEKTTYVNYEVIIIENNSTESSTFDYYNELKKNQKVNVLYWKGKGFNYSEVNNFGAQFAKGKQLIFLNNDIEIITPNWIEEMLMYSQRNDVGAVGIKLYFPDDTIQHAGVILGLGGIAGHIYLGVPRDTVGYIGRLHYAQNMSAVTAACLMVKKTVFFEVGCFSHEFCYSYNDVDLCMKIRRANYLNVWTPFAEAYHHESKSRGYHDTAEKQSVFVKEVELFEKKWAKELDAGDPYYNCNFSLERPDYFIKGN